MPKTKFSKLGSKSGRNSNSKSTKKGKPKTKTPGGCGCSIGGGDEPTDYTIILLCLLFFLAIIYYYIYMENQKVERVEKPKEIEGFSEHDFNGDSVPTGTNMVSKQHLYTYCRCGRVQYALNYASVILISKLLNSIIQ